jgi:hypothetical protein
LDAASVDAYVYYYRCGSCGHVWTRSKDDGSIVKHITPDSGAPAIASVRTTWCASRENGVDDLVELLNEGTLAKDNGLDRGQVASCKRAHGFLVRVPEFLA